MPITLPAATDPTESLADWMELEALRSKDKSTSVASLVKLLRRTGSTDAIVSAGGDSGSQLSQSIAQDAFGEIENRAKACGKDRYPFEVTMGSLSVRPKPEAFTYTALLLMSINKPTTGHDGTSALFENICARATLGYLGGSENGVVSVRFGSPRKSPLGRLSKAIDDLCLSVGEGDGCRRPELARHTGDDGLDIVAWRSFPDEKQGKLIAFGQCAAGASDWQNKLAEMDSRSFVKKWMRAPLLVDPVRLFFVPRRVSPRDWESAGIDGGILFDRCRIAACYHPDPKIEKQCRDVSKAMLKGLK
ncbi:hypothetical protein [Bradyrhizobium japonicum]|uniref:hypothetical protein n=1 Tax=Bradyrhizobium japonicum TaxID=375 RepID=UPI0012BD33F2|nr:hypothetical protein [Bradyrhizobium japonicum]